jgi:succinate-semialdehyde dehydrogenase / glutarate-semialdehyde dehydrogenase
MPEAAGAATAGVIDVRNPRTGAIDYRFVPPTGDELAARARSLRQAQPQWQALGIAGRCAVMARFAVALEAHREEIVAALAIDTGRRHIAAGELASVVRNIGRWCERAPGVVVTSSFDSTMVPTLTIAHQLVPYPLVGVISPWNFPLVLSMIDAVPALIAGCAVLLKPSEVTPRFVAPLVRAIGSVPELAAVFAVVAGGRETGAGMIPLVDAVCFTGSVATGRKVGVAAAEHFVAAFLELGGKDPAIVLPGADLERASDGILRGSCLATGQACLAIERVYVHESNHDELVDRLVEKSRLVRCNYPDIDAGEIGPLIFAPQADIIDAHLDEAVAKGAVIRCGGKTRTLGGGRYAPATVVTHVTHDMKLMTDETFGPVTPVMKYRTIDEAVALANDTIYGLSAAVFGPTLAAAQAVAERINAGGVTLNDTGMTRETYEAEKHSFGASGTGGSRHGDAGLLRFYRKKALFGQRGTPVKLV